MHAPIPRSTLLSLLLTGCFDAIVDPAGHPCTSDAECGRLVCDPDAMVCVDPNASTGSDATETTLTSGPTTTSSPTSASTSSDSSTDDASSTSTDETDSGSAASSGEPGELGIDAVVPDKGRADIHREVVVDGSGFTAGVAVYFGDDAAEILSVQAEQIAVRVPPNAAAVGPVDVRVDLDGDQVELASGYTRVRGHPTFEALAVVALLDSGIIPAAADAVVGQFVGDAALDVVFVGENGRDGAVVAAGDGTGDFVVVWEHDDPAVSIAPADVDEDGELDFVTIGQPGLRTYVNDGFDGFQISTFPGVIGIARGIATLDADGIDGPDVVVRGAYDTGIQVWLNDGGGDLFAPTIYAADEITSGDIVVHPSIGDFTGDGHDDILAPVEPPAAPVGGFALFANDGDGNFLDPVFTDLGVPGRDSVAVHVDLGNDGHLDALALGHLNAIFVLAGNGDGTFEDADIGWPLVQGAGQVAGGDLNCDDATDLVISDSGASFAVHRGSAGGSYTLSSTETFDVAGANRALAIAEIDGDGLPDLVVVHHAPDGALEIRPYRNTSAQ